MNPEFQKSLLDILQNQQKILDQLMQNQYSASSSSQQAVVSTQRNHNQEFLIESLSSGITEFTYDPENGVTFAAWFSRYEDLFIEDAKNLDDAAKVRLLLRNISTVAHQKYISYILPKKSKDQNFEQTVSTLKIIFGRQISLFNARYQCLQLSKSSGDDFYTYAGVVNQKCEEFKLNEVTSDQFKCLMYVCGLKSHRDADIRTTLLSRIESNKPGEEMTVHKLAEECQRLINLKRDTAMVEKQGNMQQTVCAINRSNPSKSTNSEECNDVPRSPCWRCGDMHYSKYCSFINHECRTCQKTGHKEGYCACFEKVGKKQKENGKQRFNHRMQAQAQGVFSINQIGLMDRRKYITVQINGVSTKLQLDCASDITIIPEDVYVQLGSPAGRAPSIDAVNASGEDVGLSREVECNVSFNGITKKGRCFVTTVPALSLFGIEWIEMFNLWNVPINAVCNNVKLQRRKNSLKSLKKSLQAFSVMNSGYVRRKYRSRLNLASNPSFV